MTTRKSMDELRFTEIFRHYDQRSERVGYINDQGVIYRDRWGDDVPVGRVDDKGRVYRNTQHDERELGIVDSTGRIHSHGLFEGGPLGWLEADGVVIQAGLIFEEEEIGHVAGPRPAHAAAALLLLFLPDERESDRIADRQ